ncbi:hypothetical protein LTR10_010565 [Elasticomyces elasticus]|nr:hypothetical protein LTR10_010565 [Elasticomyces elasticus]KAK4972465.1 hypothetical protein LTR42_006975 [Elasticomyces elasticus]
MAASNRLVSDDFPDILNLKSDLPRVPGLVVHDNPLDIFKNMHEKVVETTRLAVEAGVLEPLTTERQDISYDSVVGVLKEFDPLTPEDAWTPDTRVMCRRCTVTPGLGCNMRAPGSHGTLCKDSILDGQPCVLLLCFNGTRNQCRIFCAKNKFHAKYKHGCKNIHSGEILLQLDVGGPDAAPIIVWRGKDDGLTSAERSSLGPVRDRRHGKYPPRLDRASLAQVYIDAEAAQRAEALLRKDTPGYLVLEWADREFAAIGVAEKFKEGGDCAVKTALLDVLAGLPLLEQTPEETYASVEAKAAEVFPAEPPMLEMLSELIPCGSCGCCKAWSLAK